MNTISVRSIQSLVENPLQMIPYDDTCLLVCKQSLEFFFCSFESFMNIKKDECLLDSLYGNLELLY